MLFKLFFSSSEIKVQRFETRRRKYSKNCFQKSFNQVSWKRIIMDWMKTFCNATRLVLGRLSLAYFFCDTCSGKLVSTTEDNLTYAPFALTMSCLGHYAWIMLVSNTSHSPLPKVYHVIRVDSFPAKLRSRIPKKSTCSASWSVHTRRCRRRLWATKSRSTKR